MGTTSNVDRTVRDKRLLFDANGRLLVGTAEEAETSRIRFDYDGRTDGQAVYIGLAPDQAQASADVVWRVLKFEYASGSDGADTLQFDAREPLAWDNRADPTADGLTAWDW